MAEAASQNRGARALEPSTGLIPWIPVKPKRGTISRRWGVVMNEGA